MEISADATSRRPHRFGVALVAFIAVGCRTATQFTVDLRTDIPCATVTGTSIAV
jgi:hypothetical protein